MANKWNETAVIRGALRRAFSRSPVVREVLMAVRREVPKYNKDGGRAKKDSVQYRCGICTEWHGSTKVAVDHIIPVMSPEEAEKPMDWSVFIKRLFCDKSNLQPVCKTCHEAKTSQERELRLTTKHMHELNHLAHDVACGVTSVTLKRLKALSKSKVKEVSLRASTMLSALPGGRRAVNR